MTEQTTASGKALASLRDLDGVVGSFLLGPSGAIVAQDLPSYFGSAAYEMGPRAQRLREALQITEGEMSLCMLRYGAHKVSLRPVGKGILTVIAQSDVNVPALRMATTLVSKKLGPR